MEDQLKALAANIATGNADSVEDLFDVIDKKNSNVLNNDPKTPLESVLTGGSLKSDSDEQLLVTIAFNEAVKLKAISFKVNEMKLEGCSGPAKVKLFLNKPNMDFDDAENLNETQEFELTEADLKSGKPVETNFVKFQNVNSVTIFIETNQDEEEVTMLNKLQLFGCVRKGTNMSELKKVG